VSAVNALRGDLAGPGFAGWDRPPGDNWWLLVGFLVGLLIVLVGCRGF
jgi:hypothetical protein